MYQHGFHWTDFYDILYSKLLLKCVGKTKTSLQWGKDFGQFTRTFNYFLLVPATLNRHKKALFKWNGARLSVRPSVFLFVPMSVCLSVCQYFCLSLCLYVCPSVRISSSISAAPTGRICVKFRIGNFQEKL